MWHSKDVENGSLRVNYYIKEMFGDPNNEPNVWKSPLAILVATGKPEIFEHPVASPPRVSFIQPALRGLVIFCIYLDQKHA